MLLNFGSWKNINFLPELIEVYEIKEKIIHYFGSMAEKQLICLMYNLSLHSAIKIIVALSLLKACKICDITQFQSSNMLTPSAGSIILWMNDDDAKGDEMHVCKVSMDTKIW